MAGRIERTVLFLWWPPPEKRAGVVGSSACAAGSVSDLLLCVRRTKCREGELY